MVIPKLSEKVDSTLQKANLVLAEVERKMEEFQDWISYVKPMDMTAEKPMEIVNSLNEIILDKSLSSTLESL